MVAMALCAPAAEAAAPRTGAGAAGAGAACAGVAGVAGACAGVAGAAGAWAGAAGAAGAWAGAAGACAGLGAGAGAAAGGAFRTTWTATGSAAVGAAVRTTEDGRAGAAADAGGPAGGTSGRSAADACETPRIDESSTHARTPRPHHSHRLRRSADANRTVCLPGESPYVGGRYSIVRIYPGGGEKSTRGSAIGARRARDELALDFPQVVHIRPPDEQTLNLTLKRNSVHRVGITEKAGQEG
ncbi:hypothetical protein FVO59_05445 [Microbacterium esteraromaticum]|uniref:Uncharacterized protein n=1 Tax=Microbacterium esteraromaticum TaxID=57043 RepID=A0A7D8AE62_9MICO|nr:hypothetical protein FVO59_05445 [Microbacterium esteraromaticum]